MFLKYDKIGIMDRQFEAGGERLIQDVRSLPSDYRLIRQIESRIRTVQAEKGDFSWQSAMQIEQDDAGVEALAAQVKNPVSFLLLVIPRFSEELRSAREDLSRPGPF